MSKAGISLPTRQQPTRACKRAVGDVGFYSLKPTKCPGTETSDKQTKQSTGRRSLQVHPPTRNDLPNRADSTTRSKSVSNVKCKRPTADEDTDEKEGYHQSARPTKRRRYRLTKEDSSPIPEETEPKSWQLPVELLYMIYDGFWNPETSECNSPQTLHSCALTCSHWRDAVRPYIFRFITLDSTEKIERFATQIRDEPKLAQWVRKLRLEGNTLPWHDGPRQRLQDVKQDIDQWLYAFPTVVDTSFPYLQTFELFNFAQVSPRLEDREAFARWIPSLKALASVTTLNILRCEMSSNNLTALVRALPRLTRADFVDVNFTHPNWAVLHTPTYDNSHTELPQESFTEPTEILQVKCPIFHPPPSLQTFRLDNSHVLYDDFEFDLLRDWFHAESSVQCLRSLELCGRTDLTSLRDFIYVLGGSPKLSHLQVPIGPDVEDIIQSGIKISRLTNLTSIRLMGYDSDWEDVVVDNIHLFLYQLNAPRLREVAITVCFDKEDDVDTLGRVDQAFTDAKFDTLEVVRVELHQAIVVTCPRALQIPRKVKARFPLTARRVLLDVKLISLKECYLNDTIGMPRIG